MGTIQQNINEFKVDKCFLKPKLETLNASMRAKTPIISHIRATKPNNQSVISNVRYDTIEQTILDGKKMQNYMSKSN